MLSASDDNDQIPEWQAVELAIARNQGRLDAAASELRISRVLLARMLASDSRRSVAAPGELRMDSA
jgi:hypothetical protein